MGHFLPFNNLKKQNFEKMKKSQEILSLCTSVPKNMIICYTVPEIQRVTDVIFIFHFGLFFVLYPSNNPKNQNLKKKKKEKKRLEISSFYICVPKSMITWCTFPEIWCATDRRKEKSDIQRWVPHLIIKGVAPT